MLEFHNKFVRGGAAALEFALLWKLLRFFPAVSVVFCGKPIPRNGR